MKLVSSTCLLILLSGCATSKSLKISANHHAKASTYYSAIGQQAAAEEESKLANKDHQQSTSIFTILGELFNAIVINND